MQHTQKGPNYIRPEGPKQYHGQKIQTVWLMYAM